MTTMTPSNAVSRDSLCQWRGSEAQRCRAGEGSCCTAEGDGQSASKLAAPGFLWRRARADLFARWITDRARSRFLIWWRYGRNWSRLMKACHLTVSSQTRVVTPKLAGVEIGKGTDRVRLRMLEGQCPADYENRVETIAHAFKAEQCHASIVGPATVELRFRFGDALADTVLLPRVDHWSKPEGASA
ncbi:hypothetical protein [Nocardia flavorosea]|uniref:hypothetical protein n=1 Tax=Nocardia flavorosea TaxID=53429 RepID=UPI001B345E74|nr:hypothetical protein [Nocardia flavorosea]